MESAALSTAPHLAQSWATLYYYYMRIGLVCPYNYFRPGGVQFCIRDLAQELQQKGHYVRIIAPKPRQVPEDVPEYVILLGSSAEVNTPFHTKADINISRDREAIDRMFAEQKFDILHVHEPGIPMLAAQLLSRSTATNVATMHASLPEGMISKSFEKLMTPFAKYIEPKLTLVSAVSEVAKNISLGYAPNLDITIIPNAIRLAEYEQFVRSAKNTKRKKVVYIGRLERRKGVTYLLEAFARLQAQHPDTELIIAGDGRHRSRLELQAERLDIQNIEFLGFISEEKKHQLLAEADLYCSPAIYGESFGIVLLEAMAAKCVTVAGNNPGYASVMVDRGKISLVTPQDTTSFAERLELLLYDEEVRKLWLEWAAKYVQQFDTAQVVSQYESLYKRALNTTKTT